MKLPVVKLAKFLLFLFHLLLLLFLPLAYLTISSQLCLESDMPLPAYIVVPHVHCENKVR